MVIGDRLRALRQQKKLSQGDIEKRTGLLRSYISRVENNHTVPTIETLEKMVRAMEIPLYRVFYDSDDPAKAPHLPAPEDNSGGENSSQDLHLLDEFRKALSRTSEKDRNLLLFVARKMVSKAERSPTKRLRKAK